MLQGLMVCEAVEDTAEVLPKTSPLLWKLNTAQKLPWWSQELTDTVWEGKNTLEMKILLNLTLLWTKPVWKIISAFPLLWHASNFWKEVSKKNLTHQHLPWAYIVPRTWNFPQDIAYLVLRWDVTVKVNLRQILILSLGELQRYHSAEKTRGIATEKCEQRFGPPSSWFLFNWLVNKNQAPGCKGLP